MNKKFFNLLFIFIFWGIAMTYGQVRKPWAEKIYSQKVSFFTQKIGLTPEEAQVFWPVYNEYQLKHDKIIESKRQILAYYNRNQKKLSDKEIENILDRYIHLEHQQASLQSEYYKKFKAILPIEKVARLYQSEIQFKGMLLRQIKNK